jgi:LPXTG-motif cell wall-anchored protein
MFRGDIATNNVFWTFGAWGDGTYFLTNTANGTDWHMNKKDNGIMAMSPNITAPQNGQRYDFKAVGKIDDARYSSVDVSRA